MLARSAGTGVFGAVVLAGVLGAANRAGMLAPQAAQTATAIFGHRTVSAELLPMRPLAPLRALMPSPGAEMVFDGREPVGAVAADAAYQSTLDLISVANSKVPWTSEPMMKSDLMQAMLQHVGNDMFLIDTVDKAARFGIEIVGAGPPPALTEASAYYACLNTLQWQHGLTDAPITYTPKMSEPTAEYLQAVRLLPTGTVDKAYRINGPKDGYARHGCVVAEIEGRVQICGVDEYTNVVAGGGSCEDTDYAGKLQMVQALALYDPMTPLRSLGARKVATTPSNHALPIFRCIVRNEVAIEDDELCKFVGGRSSEGWDTANFIWPSGSKTVLVLNPAGMEINGVRTIAIDRDGLGLCYPNSRTGREFCVATSE